MKVLLIEDDEDVRCVASLSLSLLGGLQVVEADCGKDGLELAAKEKPDAILLDLSLSEQESAETIDALRKNPQTADIPVVFLTTRTPNSDSSELLKLGAVGILHKPFDPATLASELQEIIRS